MPDYIGPALRSLSGTLQRGFEGIGESRLKESEYGLKKAELMERIRERQEEAPLRALKLTQAQDEMRRIQEQNEPFRVVDVVKNELLKAPTVSSGGPFAIATSDISEHKLWISKLIPKVASAFGPDVEYDVAKDAYVNRSTGRLITKKDVADHQDDISAIIGANTDGEKYLEMEANSGNEDAAKELAKQRQNPIAYLNKQLQSKVNLYLQQEKKHRELGTMGFGAKALETMKGGIKHTQTQIDKLEEDKRSLMAGITKTEEERIYERGKLIEQRGYKAQMDEVELFNKSEGTSVKVPRKDMPIWTEKGFSIEKPGKEPSTDEVTIYGPGGQTRKVYPGKEKEYIPPEGWSLSKPERPTGALTENQVSKNLLDLAMGKTDASTTIEQVYSQYYNEYQELVNAGMGREEAYNELLKKHGVKSAIKPKPGGGYSYLWD